MFEADLETNLTKCRSNWRTAAIIRQAVRRKWNPKPGSKEKRPLGIPTVRSR